MAAADMGLDRAEVAMIGDDAEFDAIAASRAGLTGWLVRTGKWAPGRVPVHADATIAEFDDLASAIAHFLGSECR